MIYDISGEKIARKENLMPFVIQLFLSFAVVTIGYVLVDNARKNQRWMTILGLIVGLSGVAWLLYIGYKLV
jgi:hypothetical protein